MSKRRPTGKAKTKTTTKKSTSAAAVEPAEMVIPEEAQAEALAVAATATAVRRVNRISRQQAKTLALEEEYAYVVKDLRRVFILAGIMFAGLIAVNLIFTYLGS